jgi:hypothetical protein
VGVSILLAHIAVLKVMGGEIGGASILSATGTARAVAMRTPAKAKRDTFIMLDGW